VPVISTEIVVLEVFSHGIQIWIWWMCSTVLFIANSQTKDPICIVRPLVGLSIAPCSKREETDPKLAISDLSL
jgi:hypothetical protein